jgi:hypothetical protein
VFGLIGGVMVHRDCTRPFGFTLPEQRRDEANTRYVEAILTYLGTLDERRPEDRFAGTCREFTVLLCAMLREASAGRLRRVLLRRPLGHRMLGRRSRLAPRRRSIASAPKGTYTDVDIDPLDVPRPRGTGLRDRKPVLNARKNARIGRGSRSGVTHCHRRIGAGHATDGRLHNLNGRSHPQMWPAHLSRSATCAGCRAGGSPPTRQPELRRAIR